MEVMNDTWKKDYPLFADLTEEGLDDNNSLKKMLRLVGGNKRVIDFGCATGYFAQMLTQRGCKVTGVEINPDAALVAEQYCERVIVADLDLVSLPKILPCQAFDVAIFGDILEHLRDPWKVLKEAQQLLKPEGYVVASIPNIAHGAIRLALLQGRFEYTELGILDNTHLRFFTRKTVEDLFEQTGYFIENIDRTKIAVFEENPLIPRINKAEFSREIIEQIEQEKEAETLQFILRAVPSYETDKYAGLSERYYKIYQQLERSQSIMQQAQAELERSQSQLLQTQTEKEQLQSLMQQVQAELERSQSQLEQTQAELEQLHATAQSNQTEWERSQSQLQQTQTELEQLQSQLLQTQTELEKLHATVQHTQTDWEQLQSQLQQTQAELERFSSESQQAQTEKQQLQSQLRQTQAELAQLQSQEKQTQAELERSQANITGMESSKFWKLRNAWFNIKQKFGLTEYQTTNAPTSVTIPGVNDVREIKFKTVKNSINGYFDGINGVNTTIEVPPQETLLTASGWAILADKERLADSVIITYGKHNSIVAVAAVNLPRPDVVKALKNPAYMNCGWRITINSSNLPAGRVTFKAWAYNSASKEAIRLNLTSSKSELKYSLSRLKYIYAVLKAKGMWYGISKLSQKIANKLNNSPIPTELIPAVFQNSDPYRRWLDKNFPREADLRRMAETTDLLGYKPTLSVIMPVYNTPEQFLREAIETVLQQVYPYWELCIADDASTKSHVRTVLEEYIAKDPRIKVVFRDENGHISRASNSALEIATGEFVTLLDHDDLLTPDALYEVALLLNRHPDADMIYSDEDKVDEHNQFKDPFFKPEWCPDSFLSRMYTCHLGTYRRSLVEQIGGFRAGFEGSQDYDLVLRFTEKTENIYHIPKILYHWRIHSESTAAGTANVKTYAYEAAEKAITEALYRRGENGQVTGIPGFFGNYMVRYEIEEYKPVSIIIPTRDLGDILHKCLESIFTNTVYPNYEVIIIDNGSKEEKTAKLFAEWIEKEPSRFKCYPLDIPFNYSKLNNYAATKANGDYLLFLNNDTEIITPDWIDAMVEQAQRPSIGAVGALLLYPDDTVQHAGIVLGLGGVAAHSHRHFPSTSPGYFCQVNTVNNFSAVTGACLMCRREVYESVGGFDEQLVVAYNDVDLCLKMVEKGYRNIYVPHAVLYHYESKSRGYEDTPEKVSRLYQEAKYLRGKWEKIIDNDPCYSLHLTRDREDYSINI